MYKILRLMPTNYCIAKSWAKVLHLECTVCWLQFDSQSIQRFNIRFTITAANFFYNTKQIAVHR